MDVDTLYKLIIDTDSRLFDDNDSRIRKGNVSIAPVSIVRDGLLKALSDRGADKKNPRLWEVLSSLGKGPRALPVIHYAHPFPREEGSNEIHVFGRGKLGLNALEFLREYIDENFIDLGTKSVRVIGSGILCDYAAVPIKGSSKKRIFYRAVTPLVLFTEKPFHQEWKRITMKYMYSDPDSYIENARSLIERRVREELCLQVQTLALDSGRSETDFPDIPGCKIEDFSDLRVESFFIYPGRCNQNRIPTPLVRSVFSTEWSMPQFLGRYSDIGFGMIKPINAMRPLPVYDPFYFIKRSMGTQEPKRRAG